MRSSAVDDEGHGGAVAGKLAGVGNGEEELRSNESVGGLAEPRPVVGDAVRGGARRRRGGGSGRRRRGRSGRCSRRWCEGGRGRRGGGGRRRCRRCRRRGRSSGCSGGRGRRRGGVAVACVRGRRLRRASREEGGGERKRRRECGAGVHAAASSGWASTVAVRLGRGIICEGSAMDIRYYIDPETDSPHILSHGVGEDEIADVLASPIEDRPGREGARIALGRTRSGRYLRVVYVPDPWPGEVFVITAYELRGKPLAAFRRRRRHRRGQ